MKAIGIFFIIFFCLPGFSFSQTAPILFDQYTTGEGLSNNTCKSIVQDDEGFIWIGTDSGLNRFDGKDFVNYFSSDSPDQLPGNTINKLIRLPGHRLAVATNNGLAILNTRTGFIQRLTIPAKEELFEITNTIWDIITDSNGNLVASSSGGVYVFDAKGKLIFRYDPYKPKDIGKTRLLFTAGPSLHLLPDGQVLVKGNFNILYLLNLQKGVLQNLKDVPGKEFDLLKRWNGNLGFVLGSNSDGLLFIAPYYPKCDSFYVVDILHQKTVVSALSFSGANEIEWQSNIFSLHDGLLSINTSNHIGVYEFRMNKESMFVSMAKNILPGYYCSAIMMDIDGRIWAGTDEGLIKQSFSKTAIHTLFPPSPVSGAIGDKKINGIIHFQHRYFINEWSMGTFVYDDNLQFIQQIKYDKIGKHVWPLEISQYVQDTLIISTGAGALLLNTIDNSVQRFWKKGMPVLIDTLGITSILMDSHHQLWMGMSHGHGVFQLNTITHTWKYFSPNDTNAVFKLRYPTSMAEDRYGNIWMGGAEGITRWNQEKQTFDTLVLKLPGLTDMISSWSFLTTDTQNNLWILKSNLILVKWNLRNQQITIFRKPDNLPPLRGDFLYGPWNDDLWMITDKGLLSFNTETEQYQLIRKSDGLYDDVIGGCFYFDAESSRVFAGFDKAFNWFTPHDVLKEKKPVETLITSLRKIDGSASFATDSLLSFSSKDNSFLIDFTGINFEDGRNNTYAYRLYEGTPTPFLAIGGQKSVTLASLKPGAYTFEVKTILSDGTESITPTSMHFNIAYPYYQTWWFYLLCAMTITGGAYALYRYRINKMMQLQNMRNSIAGDLHDDIGSSLSSISILSELAKAKSPQAASLLNTISESAVTLQENMSDIVWAVNAKNDRFENVLQRMNHFASEILEAKNIELEFKSDEVISSSKLSMNQRKNLYLIFKEALNNAAKYSEAKKVTVNISQKDHAVEMQITDDGKGFDPARIFPGNGMNTLKKRAGELGGTLNINSKLNEGTQIRLDFKIT